VINVHGLVFLSSVGGRETGDGRATYFVREGGVERGRLDPLGWSGDLRLHRVPQYSGSLGLDDLHAPAHLPGTWASSIHTKYFVLSLRQL
jgi:hypothetical protein